jgi:hypothetical protein
MSAGRLLCEEIAVDGDGEPAVRCECRATRAVKDRGVGCGSGLKEERGGENEMHASILRE